MNYNVKHITGTLPTIELKHKLPQIGGMKFMFNIIDDHIVFTKDHNWSLITDTKIDFVIDDDYNIHFGLGHYKLNCKKETLRMAGSVKVNNRGKIYYIDNDSGHYEPDPELFESFIPLFIPLMDNNPTHYIQKTFSID